MQSPEKLTAEFLRYLSLATRSERSELELAMYLESELNITLTNSEIEKLGNALAGTETDRAGITPPSSTQRAVAMIKQVIEEARTRGSGRN